jgi:ZIP family zinc transporter/zinc and cadmium transporter
MTSLSPAALPLALLAALANVAGAVAVTTRSRWSVRSLETMIALSAGFMISVAIADVLPEAIERGGRGAGLVATIGFLGVHLTQHTFARHFHFGEETHHVSRGVGVSALVGLLLHTFVDGVAIASGFASDARLGVLLASAILLHKLPEGLAISSLVLATGAGRARALGSAALLGMATLLGLAVASLVPALLGTTGLALAAGVTLYVAAANLVPEIQGKAGWRLPVAFFFGSGLYFAARAVLERGMR